MNYIFARSALLLALIPLACGDRPGATSESATGISDGSSSTSEGSTGSAGSTDTTDTTGTSTSSSTSTDTGTTTTTTDSPSTSASSSSGGSSSSTGGPGDACETPSGIPDPWLEPLGPGDEPCEPTSIEACTTEDALAGFRQCLGFEIAEDVTEFSWGPCMPSCSEGEANDGRACGPGDAGVSYCGDLFVNGGLEYVWFPCLDPGCQPCTPGDTELCGPDTPYPDTLKKCLLSQGVPYWFDGDCYT